MDLNNLVSHPYVSGKIDFFPDFTDLNVAIPLFFVPIAVQWWSAWYPGAEPGGGGYIAQRMLSAKNEKEATRASLLFNIAHYALRPWPWILIALASLIVFPDLESIRQNFPGIDAGIIEDDIAFPAMLSYLPKGLLGLVIASLIAALMSTISTHLNWGASYIVHDFYSRFINTNATEKTKVGIGRTATLILMILSGIMALYLTNAMQAFNILLQIGAGTGLLFLLRWFWWRINAYSELAAMTISFIVAIYFELIYGGNMEAWQKLLIGVTITTVVWIIVTLISRPTELGRLKAFYMLIQPHAHGWKPVINEMADNELDQLIINDHSLSQELLLIFLSCLFVYCSLFGIGYLLYGASFPATISLLLALICGTLIGKFWNKK